MTGTAATIEKSAQLSECGLYRYTLTRHWGPGESLMFVMLNPSTADHRVDDRTVGRCMGFARREGYDGILVANLYALRTKNPKNLLMSADPFGPENNAYLVKTLTERVRRGLPVVAAWGAFRDLDDRQAHVLGLVSGVDWRCLGTTAGGAPRHPLYVRGDQPLIPFAA